MARRVRKQGILALLSLILVILGMIPTSPVAGMWFTDCTPQIPVDSYRYTVAYMAPNAADPTHGGFDYATEYKQAVKAILSGTVSYVGNWPSWATSPWYQTAIVESVCGQRRYYILYEHLLLGDGEAPVVGQTVTAGEPFAKVGDRAGAVYWTDFHLHVSVFRDGIDPMAIERKEYIPQGSWSLQLFENPQNLLGSGNLGTFQNSGQSNGGAGSENGGGGSESGGGRAEPTAVSLESLPFVNDISADVAKMFNKQDCADLGDVRYIVLHQISVGKTGSDVSGMDGMRLASAFKGKPDGNGGYWDKVGYTYLVTEFDAGNGFARVDQMWPLTCYSYGVPADSTDSVTNQKIDFVNTHAVQIAYVDNPTGSAPKSGQMNSTLALMLALKQKYPGAQVRGHKEFIAPDPTLQHSDPTGVDMNSIRAQLDEGLSVTAGYTLAIPDNTGGGENTEVTKPGSSYRPADLSMFADFNAVTTGGVTDYEDNAVVERVIIQQILPTPKSIVLPDTASFGSFMRTVPQTIDSIPAAWRPLLLGVGACAIPFVLLLAVCLLFGLGKK